MGFTVNTPVVQGQHPWLEDFGKVWHAIKTSESLLARLLTLF